MGAEDAASTLAGACQSSPAVALASHSFLVDTKETQLVLLVFLQGLYLLNWVDSDKNASQHLPEINAHKIIDCHSRAQEAHKMLA